MEITAFRSSRTTTTDLEPTALPAAATALAAWPESAAPRLSMLRVALAVAGMLVLTEAASPLAVVLLLYVVHSVLVHWAASINSATTESRAWHWFDVGWSLAVVAASGAHGLGYLFFLYPILVASLRGGTREGAAVTLVAIAGWLAIGLVHGASTEWQPTLLRAASLAILGYALALGGGFAAVQQQRLRQLAETAADSERTRISLDLHDGAIQPYLGLKLGLEALRRKMEPGNPLAPDIDELCRMTQESIAELRGYVRVLRGRADERAIGFAEALRRQVERFRRFYGLEVKLELACGTALPPRVAEGLVQMVGESLSNIGRHTAARQVEIALTETDAGLLLRILDDGGAHEAPWRHFTPLSLTLRARQLGGQVEVAPRGGGGSELRILIPI